VAAPATGRVAFPALLGTGPFQACPVDDGTYGDSFGIPSMRSGYHIHQGVDVFARYGSPVRAPFAGRAVVATNPIGGIAVKVFGEAGYVYNAHLSALGALGPVRPGTIIGYAGDTGNARGTSPHDHFEWHPGDGPAVDPYALLNEAC
jgi:peptidoglycan LD-endopeptidase LytH